MRKPDFLKQIKNKTKQEYRCSQPDIFQTRPRPLETGSGKFNKPIFRHDSGRRAFTIRNGSNRFQIGSRSNRDSIFCPQDLLARKGGKNPSLLADLDLGGCSKYHRQSLYIGLGLHQIRQVELNP